MVMARSKLHDDPRLAAVRRLGKRVKLF